MVRLPATPWNAPVEAVRRALLDGNIKEKRLRAETTSFVPFVDVLKFARAAALAGCVFDLGYMPNGIIITESDRARELYRGDYIGHPFSRPWVIYHTWESGSCLYLVVPGKSPAEEQLFFELRPSHVDGNRVIVMNDVASVRFPPDQAAGSCFLRWRWQDLENGPSGKEVISNCVEPVLAAMLLLVTENVQTSRVTAQKHFRSKTPLRPGETDAGTYFRVHAAPYVTALLSRATRSKAPAEGTHASPIPHLRRGHIRNLPNGKTTWVRDCLVNIDENAIGNLARTHYTMVKA